MTRATLDSIRRRRAVRSALKVLCKAHRAAGDLISTKDWQVGIERAEREVVQQVINVVMEEIVNSLDEQASTRKRKVPPR